MDTVEKYAKFLKPTLKRNIADRHFGTIQEFFCNIYSSSTLITIRGRAGIIIGIEADIHLSRILVIDLSGKKLESLTFRLTNSDPMHFFDSLEKYVHTFQSKYNTYPLGVIGVGLALPSITITRADKLNTWPIFRHGICSQCVTGHSTYY